MKKLILIIALVIYAINGFSQSITTVSPDSARQGESLTVTITGTSVSFSQGSNLVRLNQGPITIAAESHTVKNATTIDAVFSVNADHPKGLYDVQIVTPGGTNITKPNGFKVLEDLTPAGIDNASPLSAAQGSSVEITINTHNANFAGVAINNVWLVNGMYQVYPASITVLNNNSLKATFSFSYSKPAGNYTIYVNNKKDGTMSYSSFVLNAGPNPPAIKTVTPDSAYQGEKIKLTITGENINFSQGSNVITISNSEATIPVDWGSATAVNANTLSADLWLNKDNPVGIYNVTVNNSVTAYTVTKNNAFKLLADKTPANIDSISPKTSVQGRLETITIYAHNANFTKCASSIYATLQQTNLSKTISVIDDNTIKASFFMSYSIDTGKCDIAVYDALDGQIILGKALYLKKGTNVPKLLAVHPDTIQQDQTLAVTISGENVDFTQGSLVISFKQGTISTGGSVTAIRISEIDLLLNMGKNYPLGDYDLKVSYSNSSSNLFIAKAIHLVKSVEMEITMDDSVLIYPNPCNGQVFINSRFDPVLYSQIIDLQGKTVKEISSASGIEMIDLGSVPPGMYFIRMKNKKGFICKKLMVQ